MNIYLVLEHTPTTDKVAGRSIGAPFTGSDIRRVVYWDFDSERAEQYATVATLTCLRPAIVGYTVKETIVEMERESAKTRM